MASLVPGFEYDIFVSYRQNDNQTGWVTDFVQALKEELASTIKETVTIYFDINPSDGLQETHNVDKSIKGKLNCFILLPILSQTYCDPKSFAWEHEFVEFNKLARQDSFGMDIKLRNGNVTSRLLPIKIHELDPDDVIQIENETGAKLRPIEFFYKEVGVNRPLKPEDKKADNLNKTEFRNQVNKTANAIKEIIHSGRNSHQPANPSVIVNNAAPPLSRSARKKTAAITILIAVVGIACFAYFFAFNRAPENPIANNSLAVLPLANLSGDQSEYLAEGITDQLITSLGHVEGLKVASRTSVMLYKKSALPLEQIATQLNVGYILEGSVQKADDQLKITVRLIRANDNFQKWSETFTRNFKEMLSIQDEISKKVASSLDQVLNLSALRGDKPNNTEAYDHFLRGEFLWRRVESANIRDAITEFKEATRLDPEFPLAYSRVGFGYLILASPWGDTNLASVVDSATYYNEQGLKIDPELSDGLYTKATIIWWAKKDVAESERLFREALKYSHNSISLLDFGMFLNTRGRAEEALKYCKEGSKLDPSYLGSYLFTGDSYFLLKQYEQAEAQYRQGLKLYPTNTDIIYRLAWLYCNTNRFDEARNFLIEKSKLLGKRDPRPLIYLAIAYAKTGRMEEAKSIVDGILSAKKEMTVFDPNLYLAVYNCATGQRDKMYGELEKSMQNNEIDLIWLKVDPVFEPYRSEPRFQDLLIKVGLHD